MRDLKEIGMYIVYFIFYSTIILNIGILLYVGLYDFSFIPLYDVAASIDGQGLLQSGFLDIMGDMIIQSQIILQYFDMMWVLSFVTMVMLMFYASYNLKRPNHFSLLFYIFYGVMVLMFILNIFLQIIGWWNEIFLEGLFKNITIPLPFYTLYIDNVGVVSALILLICIALNFVDFDLLTFQIRKKEQRESNDEI